ncbi:hypothetical protein HK101_006380 [Irineochytrium annulatum]|nr:hypothetical protein HK101_006380 [Irineochytrium annulatum]
MPIQPNKAIVGANAFSHESGIHQDGVLKHKATYEIIQPEVIGLPSNALVLGKHSGRNAFRTRIDQILGGSVYADQLRADPTQFETLFVSFKRLADTKKSGVTEQDLYALLDDQLNTGVLGVERYRLKSCQVVSGTGVLATATVAVWDTAAAVNGAGIAAVSPMAGAVISGDAMDHTSPSAPLIPPVTNGLATSPSSGSVMTAADDHHQSTAAAPPGIERMDAAIGHGPVHAIFSAINRITGFRNNVLASYEVKAVTEGSDSLGKVVVRIHEEGEDDTGAEGEEYLARLPRHGSDLEKDLGGIKDREMFCGYGTDEDILVASAKAYLNAVNRLICSKKLKEERRGSAAENGKVEVPVVGGVVPAVPPSRKVDV